MRCPILVLKSVSKKNLPELAASLVRPPASPPAFPLAEERTHEERAWRDLRIRPELDRDASASHATHKKLGESVGWIVDTLLQDEEGVTDPERLQHIKQRKREALECLAYVRDVLNGTVTQVEDDRLVGEEELTRRQNLAIQKESARFSASSGNSKMQIEPPPAAAASSVPGTGVRTRDMGLSSSQNPFTCLPEESAHIIPRSTVPIAPRPKVGPSRSQPATSLARSPPGSSVLSSPPNSFASRPASNFGAPSPQMSTALPRRPPPTSSAPRGQSPAREALVGNGTKRRSTVQDPLGVLS
jgi:TBC1 domain family member 5